MWGSQVALVVKNLPANAGDIRNMSSFPGSGRSPGGGYSNPLKHPRLENPMDRGTWWATVRRDTESDMTEAMQQEQQQQSVSFSILLIYVSLYTI